MDKQNIQDKELENVSAGGIIENMPVECRCQNCNTVFDTLCAENKFIKTGCSGDDEFFKCPGCGKWVDYDGKVQE